MKKSWWISLVILLLACGGQKKKPEAGSQIDPLARDTMTNDSISSSPVADTLRREAPRHRPPNPGALDSLKRAKTRKKEQGGE